MQNPPYSVQECSLYVLEQPYDKLRSYGVVKAKDGVFKFSGQIDTAKVAFLKFEGISEPFYFVLEPCDETIVLGTTTITVSGSRESCRYFAYLNKRKSMLASKQHLHDAYRKLARDSSLTRSEEGRFCRQDSLIVDSLRRYTFDFIKTGVEASKIVKSRFFSTLTKEQLDKLN